GADHLRPRGEARSVRLHPAVGIVDVGDGAGIGRVRRVAELGRDDHDPVSRDGAIHRLVDETVTPRPGGTPRIPARRGPARALGPVDARRIPFIAVAQVFDFFDTHFVGAVGHDDVLSRLSYTTTSVLMPLGKISSGARRFLAMPCWCA